MYRKLLRFNDDIYGVSCLTAATDTNAADNHSSYLTEHILPSVIGRRKLVHNGVDVQFISKRLVNVENSYMVQSGYRHS